MRASRLVPAFAVALAVLGLAAPAEARRDPVTMGINAGATMVGGNAQSLQPNLGVDLQIRLDDVLEMSIGTLSRDLVISPNSVPTYGIQSSGVVAAMGLRLANVSVGFQAEGALLRNVTSVGPGQLTISQGFGFIGEPYATIHLGSALAVTGYYPVVKPDPAIGPRVMASLRFDLDN